MIESVESGRDIPRYGDGNIPGAANPQFLFRPEGTSPGMGTETFFFFFEIGGQSPEGTSPGMGTETNLKTLRGSTFSPEGTSPGMGTETVPPVVRAAVVYVRKGHPQVWGRKRFPASISQPSSPEGTSPGMGTETLFFLFSPSI